MITLLHGDNIVQSRAALTDLKHAAADREIRDIDGSSLTEADLRQAVESQSLFGGTLTVVIEQLFTPLGRKETLIKRYGAIISKNGRENDIILWEPKEQGKTVLSSLENVQARIFKTSSQLFTLLDSLSPGRTAQMITALERTLETEPPELILYMLSMRVRQLIAVKDGTTPGRISPWQQSRLTNQVKSFTIDKLRSMHTQLMELEYSFKSGSSPMPLSHSITQWILDSC